MDDFRSVDEYIAVYSVQAPFVDKPSWKLRFLDFALEWVVWLKQFEPRVSWEFFVEEKDGIVSTHFRYITSVLVAESTQ